MRHGTAISGTEHPFQPLSAKGRVGVEGAAKYIKSKSLKFDVIVSSPKLRAEETAEIVAKATGYPLESIVKTDTLKPNATPEEALDFLSQYNDKESILLTGHMPSLPSLAATLIGVSVRIPFANACLYQLEVDVLPSTTGELLLLYMPVA